MPDEQPDLSSSQRGKINEFYVATALLAASGGRLSPYIPLIDDHGIDLIVLDKKTGNSLPIQVKSWDSAKERTVVQFDVRKATYGVHPGVVLFCVVVDVSRMAMEAGWLIPMADVPGIAKSSEYKFALTPSRLRDSHDRYSTYRIDDASALVTGVFRLLEDR